MSEETIARRYSAALADIVLTTGETDAVMDELAGWAAMFASSDELRTVFSNPAINYLNKEKLLESLIDRSKPAKTTANFLRILLHNGRLSVIGHINERFDSVLQERGGVVAAEITTAHELPAAERKAFQANLEKLTGKSVNIKYEINKEIIGGVVTRIGSTVYDGSIKTKLEALKEQLVSG